MSSSDYILSELNKMKIIDAHEHLPREAERIGKQADALTLFSHYCRGDLIAAGMSAQADYVFSDAPLAERWTVFEPFYRRIEHSAYTRAAHIAMKHFYGKEKLDLSNLESISEKIRANNTPGLYRRVLRDACNIETCLNQGFSEKSGDGLFTPVIRILNNPCSSSDIDAYEKEFKIPMNSLDDLLDAARKQVREIKRCGGAGIKFFVFPMNKMTNHGEAAEAFEYVRNHRESKLPLPNALSAAFFDATFDELAKQDLVACVHTGYWGDFRELHPAHLMYMLDNYPSVRFDLYHAGYPYVREAILLGKTRSNVWLNLCWTYIISPHFARDALSEILEMVPIHKLIGFGGDYFVVEKVYGHLVMAREVIADVLGTKVDARWFTLEEAVDIARMMLYDNPKALYGLK